MIILGLDAATKTGWATVSCGASRLELLSSGLVRAVDAAAVDELAERWAQLPIDFAAIEEPYVDKNPHTTIVLARIVGRWEQALELRGIPCGLFKASEWQHNLLTGLIGGRSPRGQRKTAAQTWVARECRRELGEDEADAACLAFWQAKTRGLAARARAV